MPEIVMPRLSDSMEEGTILKWLKSEGDEVALGEELVEIETDKANMVFEADEAGTLTEIVAAEGDTLPIGEVIARVGEADESKASGAEEDEEPEDEKPKDEEPEDEKPEDEEPEDEKPRDEESEDEEPEEDEKPEEGDGEEQASPDEGDGSPSSADEARDEPAEDPSSGDGDGRVKASPLARRIAGEKGLELSALKGSGPGGRIVKADVERAAESGDGDGAAAVAPVAPEAAPPAPSEPTPGAREKPETAKGPTEKVELTKLQQTVARRMAESKATAPHFYLSTEIEMTRAVEGRARLKAAAGEDDVVPSFNDMVVKACALALREFPRANGAYRDGGLELYSRVNVGVAVAARDALVVPTVFDADRKGLRQIAAETRSLAKRVRDATVTPPELSGGTFTVSNLGMYGVTDFAAVINPPQAAILAVGAIVEKPVARDGELVIGRIMGATLACDHRILYGSDGAEFLARIRSLLEEPLALAL